MNNPSEFLQFALNLAKEVGEIQLACFGNVSSLSKKSTNIDLLTNADTESENLIISKIKEAYPTHSIISEETNNIINENTKQT